jgi:hypothetical protein
MSKENKNLKTILNNNWFVPEFKPVMEKYSYGFGEERSIPTGQCESFYRNLPVTKEEFESVELGDYIRDECFNIQGIEIKMDANICSLYSEGRYADETINWGCYLGVAFYPKLEMKSIDDRCNCCDGSRYDEFEDDESEEDDIYQCESCKGSGKQSDGSLSANEVWELWENDSELMFDSIWKSGRYYKSGEIVYFTCGDPSCCWNEYFKEEFLNLADRFGKQDE